jgi:CubicO group peptidase (beta-lactamase class C family)
MPLKLLSCLCVLFLILGMSNFACGATSSMKTLPPDAIAALDRAVAAAIELELTPGAIIVAGHHDGTVFQKAYGHLTYQADARPVKLDTIYDLASLTKTIATTTSVMVLVDKGTLAVKDPVSKYLPGMNTPDKKGITIEQCLLHRAGFVADNPISDYKGAPAEALEKIYAGKLKYKPGTEYEYSDVGFIVLGEVIKAASGQPLNEFANRHVFEPLGMTDTMYLPPAKLRPRIAPTEKRNGQWIIGQVHDPRAYALGGFAGHAGVFSTGPDVARFCRMILNHGALDGRRILSEHAVAEMTTPRPLKDRKTGETTIRGYGLDIDSKYTDGPRGKRFEKDKTFGHTGYTGTSLWIDPLNDCFVVLLTNRVHPDDELEIKALRRRVSTIVADAFLGPKSH